MLWNFNEMSIYMDAQRIMSDPVEPIVSVEPAVSVEHVEPSTEPDAKSTASSPVEPSTPTGDVSKRAKIVSMRLEDAAESEGAVGAYESEPSLESLLTRETICSYDAHRTTNIIEPFCLAMVTESNSQMFEDITFNFPPNKDPGIYSYMDIVEVDV